MNHIQSSVWGICLEILLCWETNMNFYCELFWHVLSKWMGILLCWVTNIEICSLWIISGWLARQVLGISLEILSTTGTKLKLLLLSNKCGCWWWKGRYHPPPVANLLRCYFCLAPCVYVIELVQIISCLGCGWGLPNNNWQYFCRVNHGLGFARILFLIWHLVCMYFKLV